MKKIKEYIAGFSFVLFLMITPFLLASCSEQAPTAVNSQDESGLEEMVMKRPDRTVRSQVLELTDSSEPAPQDPSISTETGFGMAHWWNNKGFYKGTGFSLPSGSSFSLANGALTPPDGNVCGQDVEISMKITSDQVQNELIVSFGPHGCSFDPPAEVCIHWSSIGTAVPNLYYIDPDKGYVQQEPDAIYVYEKKMLLYISHFSRYAVAYSD